MSKKSKSRDIGSQKATHDQKMTGNEDDNENGQDGDGNGDTAPVFLWWRQLFVLLLNSSKEGEAQATQFSPLAFA